MSYFNLGAENTSVAPANRNTTADQTEDQHASLMAETLQDFDAFIEFLGLDGEYQGKEYVAYNPHRNDHELGSFSINSQTGLWADFATDDKGDLLGLVKYIKQCKFPEAISLLKDHIASRPQGITPSRSARASTSEVKADDLPCILVPADAPPLNISSQFAYLGSPTKTWAYHASNGEIMGYIARFDMPDGKKNILPFTCWKTNQGYEWLAKGLPAPRPLYDLHLLAQHSEFPVLIVEGEKSADAAKQLFPDHILTTTPNGAKAVDKADLTPLAGRDIYIWPDADEAGEKYQTTLIERLAVLEPRPTISVMKPISSTPGYTTQQQPILIPGFAPPKSWDAADAVEMGWTSHHIALLEGAFEPVEFPETVTRIGNFELSTGGLYEVKLSKDCKEFKTWIASRIDVVALSRDSNQQNWGLLVNLRTQDNHLHEFSIPKELLSSNGDLYRQILLSHGASISASGKAKEALTEYFMQASPDERVLCVNSTGWADNVFVLPHKTYGRAAERVILQSHEGQAKSPVKVSGSKSDWDTHIGSLCQGNSRLVFAICVALSGPFLKHLEVENGGFHFKGASSTGKTKALSIASSIWGDRTMIKTWSGTSNGIEGLALQFNDLVFILDELGMVSPQDAGQIAYTLGNGMQKARATRYGSARNVQSWRFLFLSNGEISLADHISSAGGQVRGGQEIRLLDIPADAESGMGIFENIHGTDKPATFADQLQHLSTQFHGTVGEALLLHLTASPNHIAQACTYIKDKQTSFITENIEPGSHGQVYRAGGRFGLVAAIGEYCISQGILPWNEGEALNAASTCFTAWLNERGSAGASEETRAIAQIIGLLGSHGMSRFEETSSEGIESTIYRPVPNRLGYRKQNESGQWDYYVLPELYQRELCRGFNPRLVTKALLQHKYLLTNSDKNSQLCKFNDLPSQTRMYVISGNILSH